MTRTLLILATFLVFAMQADATTVDGRIVTLTNNGSTYSVQVQIKVDAAKDMGGATLQFSYNTSNLSFPNSPSSGTHYAYQNFSGGTYNTATVTKTVTNGNTLSLNIELLTDNAGTTVGTGWLDVATLNFSISTAVGNSNLQWTLIEVYDEDNATQWTNGTWSGLNTSPLPVELTAFTARHAGGVTTLRWSTESELNNTGFAVERSLDAERWDSIGFVNGHFSTDVRHDYQFQDRLAEDLASRPALWYRLKQVDRDGSIEYSQAVRVTLPVAAFRSMLLAPYPNPFTGAATLSFALPEPMAVTLLITDAAGRTVQRLLDDVSFGTGTHSVRFDGEGLSAGVYHVMLRSARGNEMRTLILTR